MIKKLLLQFLSMEIIKYLMVGAFTNLLDVSIFWILETAGVYYLVGSTISTIIGLLANFMIHKRFTFENEYKPHKQIARFLFSISFNYLVSLLILYCMVEFIGVSELWSKIASLVFVAMYNFLLLKLWVFKDRVEDISE